MKNNVYKIVLLSLALVLFAAALYVYRPFQNKLTRITVIGESQTKVAPDSAMIIFSVVTQNSQAVNSQQENARKSEAVINAIKTIAPSAEIKTSDYNLQPEQDYSSSRMPKIIGYAARNSVTVRINDLNQTGAVIDTATKAGANSVEGVSFVLRENSPVRGDALDLATRQAMVKAESITQSLNGQIVRVVETHEGVISPQIPNYDSYSATANTTMSAAKTAYVTPVEAGSLNVRSQIVLTVEIQINE